MKSNRPNTSSKQVPPSDQLVIQLKKEKEALISMFLVNASISELAEQYKRIDDLHQRVNLHER